MTNQSAVAVTPVQSAAFDIENWRNEVAKCATSDLTALKRMVALCLAARTAAIEVDTAREAFQLAYGGAVATLVGVSYEAAIKSKTVQNRVSDCMAIFKAAVLPGAMPDSLQAAAKKCREANPSGRRVAQPTEDTGAKALKMIRDAIDYAKRNMGDSTDVLAALGAMTDLVDELGEALKAD